MRFLCLHGMGTSGKIFEIQTARIRRSLGENHEYIFVNGAVTANAAPGIKEIASVGEEFLRFAEDDDIHSSLRLYENLKSFASSEGPFDGIIGFSEGAGVAVSLLAHHERLSNAKLMSPFEFKCGIFFSAGPPFDIEALRQGKLQQLNAVDNKHVISLPTAHIWAAKDDVHPGFGLAVRPLCVDGSVEVFVHDLGHNIPGSRSEEGVVESVKAIRRVLERAREH